MRGHQRSPDERGDEAPRSETRRRRRTLPKKSEACSFRTGSTFEMYVSTPSPTNAKYAPANMSAKVYSPKRSGPSHRGSRKRRTIATVHVARRDPPSFAPFRSIVPTSCALAVA